jgi:aminoglycoside 6-adenylyltransferase
VSDLLARLVAWATNQDDVRALVLTSTRAMTDAPVDEFSDYDVILAVTDAARWASDRSWQSACGSPLLRWGDENALYGHTTYFRGVVYEDFAKVDYTLWPVDLLDAVAEHETLPAGLDYGYRVLLDKDGRCRGWPAPSRSAYIVARPTEAAYRALVEQFWWDATYVAKALRRGEVFFARSFMLEHDLKLQSLLRMLEWRIAADQGWAFAPGVYGRGLERHLASRPDLLATLDATYTGPGIDATWTALFHLTGLFRRVATEVAEALGYAYPRDIDERMIAYLTAVRERG